MKSIVFALANAWLAVTTVSAEEVSENYDFEGFDKIEIAGVYDLDVAVGDDFSILLSGPEVEMNRVEVSLDGDTLVLDQRKRKRGEKKRNNREGIDAVITLPALNGLSVSGVVDADIDGVDSDTLQLSLSGVGDVDIEGKCGRLKARVSGVGDFDGEALECADVTVSVSGVGDATVFASESVDATVSGIGSITVYGSPENVETSDGLFSNIDIK